MARDNDAKIRHDLRNAVNGIMGLLDVLGNTQLDSHQQKFVRMAEASARSVLDITEAAFPSEEDAQSHTVNPQEEPSRADGLSILAADDDEVNRLLIEHHLKDMSDTFTLCCNGEEALSTYSEQSYDLVILDYVMPIMSGLEAAEEIRRNSSVPILIVTGGLSSVVSGRCRELGQASLLSKPYNKADLHRCILELIPNAPVDKTNGNTEYYHFSPDILMRLAMGDSERGAALLSGLLDDMRESEEKAREALVNEDRATFKPVIQSMQSLAETINATLLSETLKKLDQSLDDESWDLISIVSGALWIHCQSLKAEIERFLESLKA